MEYDNSKLGEEEADGDGNVVMGRSNQFKDQSIIVWMTPGHNCE